MLQDCVCKQEVITKSGAPDTVLPRQSNLCVHAGFFQKCQCCRCATAAFTAHFSVLELDSIFTFCKAVFDSVGNLISL